MTDPTPVAGDAPQQSPAQWAVRWHVLVLFAMLTCAVPAWHLCWHGVLGREEPLFLGRSTIRAPQANWDTLRSGAWMESMERHLREASPVTFWLRGTWNETLYRLGVPQSRTVHVGKEEWFYAASTLRPDVVEWQRRGPARRAFFAAVKARVEAAGARLFVGVVPDKVRIYPQFAQDGALSPAKEAVYGELLGELRALGIDTVDLAAALRAEAAQSPVPIYKPRDTHWEPTGALVAARAIATAIESGPVGTELGPRLPMVIQTSFSYDILNDGPANCGFLSFVDPEQDRRSVPFSLLTHRLRDRSSVYTVGVAAPTGPVALTWDDNDARIVLAGTSFSESGKHALALVLGRKVHARHHHGAAGIDGIADVLEVLPTLRDAKVVVWEIVERGFHEEGWREPSLVRQGGG